MIKNKNTFQDITPPKRSIQDIPIPAGNDKKKSKMATRFAEKRTGKFKKKLFFLLLAIVVVCGALFALISSSVVITVVPKQEEARIDASFIAVSDSETGGVPFDIMSLDETGSKEVAVTGEEEVQEKASGKIIVFNNYSQDEQRLIINTRFETTDGLVYRIQQSITVPGQTQDATGKILPGSIEATVYADQAGEKYNIGLSDFTIPGFEGSDRFDKFYARSKTAMTGGFSGVKKVASEQDIEKARAELKTELTQKLTADIRAQTPEGFILFDDALFSSSEFMGTEEAGETLMALEKVSIYAVIFNKENLNKYIAENTLTGYKGSAISITNLADLEFEIKNKAEVKPWAEGRFVFSLKGKANFEWLFDMDKLKNDFVGQSRDNTNNILSNYPSIDSAKVIIKPFWKNSFPRSTSKIQIIKQ